ncbi:45207_t:CDS:1, partial [Gigaspora margarita]
MTDSSYFPDYGIGFVRMTDAPDFSDFLDYGIGFIRTTDAPDLQIFLILLSVNRLE